jgi:hypothetical protein
LSQNPNIGILAHLGVSEGFKAISSYIMVVVTSTDYYRCCQIINIWNYNMRILKKDDKNLEGY